ncbi:regulator of G-protein signaling 22-like isoform X2 [Halichondria panicea]
MLPLLREDLDSSTLHLYLKDSTFVEYFNSFLLLPAFSSRLFFDEESGFFEPVHGKGTKLCWEETGEATPSSSQATLYLTDENMGPALDRHQSWSWIIEHRLPLFLKSDILSEYKLCKLLSQRGPKSPPTRSHSSIRLQTSPSRKHCSDEKQSDTSLPSIIQTSTSSLLIKAASTTALKSSPITRGVSTSFSDIELTPKRHTGAILARKRSQSMDLSSLPMVHDQSTRLSSDEAKLIGSKSGMKMFWKFLRGKAGEKNWLFWLDAERVGYHTNPTYQQRLLRELRERYLHPSGPLALPAEVRNKAGVNKTSRLTLSHLKELQHTLVQRLRDYWCPRFLTHHHAETVNATLSSQPRPFSCAPVGIQDGQLTNYPRVSTPLTPTGTQTFRKLTSGRTTRSFSSPTSYRQAQEDRGSKLMERFKADIAGLSAGESEVRSAGSRSCSRRVWEKDDMVKVARGETPHQGGKKSHFDRAAKYTLHHVPDPNSRCASTMDNQFNNGAMCEAQCTILSVSGTPLHTATPTHPHTLTTEEQHASLDLYSPLISCLNTEHRKAGGYFQKHLENNQEKVFLYCLVFWREVQEYKALFIGASFSPCTVEMKAKTLYGRFISQGSEENIECPQSIVGAVSANLWPAYEDLFDSAEEHALGLLLLQWVEMVTSEEQTFQKLDSAPVRRVSGRGSRRASHTPLEELEEEPFSDEFDDGGDGDRFFLRPSSSRKISRYHSGSRRSSRVPSARSSVGQPQDRAISLNDIMKNRIELDHFKIYLNEHCAAQDLMCWMEIEAFRGIPINDKTIRNMKAKQLKTRYFNKGYLFGPNSPATKEAQRQIVSAGGDAYTGRLPARPRTPVLIEAQKHVRARLERKWLAEFMKTLDFLSRNKGGVARSVNGRRISKSSGKDMTSSYYETSFANSHEAIMFRKILHDTNQVALFLRYLDIRTIGTTSGRSSLARQDVKFWLEVQKFKEMFHAHTMESMLISKYDAIMACFLQSSAPPKLQVDVPLSVAEELARKPHGPYLFREAQAAVFKHLYSGWLDYKNYTSSYSADEMVVCLDHLESQLLNDKKTEK